MIPLRVAFFDQDTLIWICLDAFINLVFLIDLVLVFFSAYYNKYSVLVLSHRRIAASYLKGWFFVDLISILPLQLLTGNLANQLGKLARLPRIQKLLRAAK